MFVPEILKKNSENEEEKKTEINWSFSDLVIFFPFHLTLNLKTTNKKESKGAKIRNLYNQVPYLTQDTNGKVTNSQFDTTRSALSQQVTTRYI